MTAIQTERLAADLLNLAGAPYCQDADDFYTQRGEIDCAEQCLSETRAEMGSEAALFGDSWPGSEPQAQEMGRALGEMKRHQQFLRDAFGLTDAMRWGHGRGL